MAGMAQHGSAAAFSGFSVCQPALGAALQWLPAIGTRELDDMINAFLPGPASIQAKRAHISMDFFEYSRQTGESFKFYPVATASFIPVTTSPANSTPYDSGYGSSFNHSPILSEQGSWTQSPAPFAAVASDARRSRSSVSKKPSTSSSQQTTVDFANHPGMRILTKDGRDVTNSASRGCKTKEQRDHAHLMRIIKACDSCRRKKIRCDPSHRKRNVSQASTSQAKQKPAKKARKAAESPPVAVVGATADSLVGTALGADETTLSFPSFDTTAPEDVEQFWNDFITFDQEPVAGAEYGVDHFLFDHFADPRGCSPSIPSSSTSPSQVFTPITPARSGTSPAVSSDLVSSFTDEASLQDPAVPYLNPGVAHGTNYVDFNLFSPGPEVLDDDPVLEMRDLASRERSPQTHGVASSHILVADDSWCSSPGDVGAPIASAASAAQSPSSGGLDAAPQGLAADTVDASWVDLQSMTDFAPWYYDPGPSELVEGESSTGRRPTTQRAAFDVRRADVQFDNHCGSTGQPTNHMRIAEGGVSETVAGSSTQSPATETSPSDALGQSRCSRCRGPANAVHPSVPRSSVSPSTSPLPTAVTSASVGGAPVTSVHSVAPNSVTQSDTPTSAGSGVVVATMVRCGRSCSSSPAPSQPVVDVEYASSVPPDGLQVVRRGAGVLGAVLATILISISTPPTRRILAGEDVKNALFFQLAVLDLVSLLCACALQAHLASQVNLVNILAITSISLARLAPRCAGPSSASRLASGSLPSSTRSGILDSALSKTQAVTRSLRDLRCAALQRARSLTSRLALMRTLRF